MPEQRPLPKNLPSGRLLNPTDALFPSMVSMNGGGNHKVPYWIYPTNGNFT